MMFSPTYLEIALTSDLYSNVTAELHETFSKSERIIWGNLNPYSQDVDTYLTQEFSFTPFEMTAVFCMVSCGPVEREVYLWRKPAGRGSP